GDGLAAVQQIQAAKRAQQRLAHGFFAELVLIERKLRRDHGDVAHRHGALGRDENRVAAHLHGVLRSADHGGADARVGLHDEKAEIAGAAARFLGDQRPEIAEAVFRTPVDELRHAAGKHHAIDLALVVQRRQAQEVFDISVDRIRLQHGEKLVHHAGDHAAQILFGDFVAEGDGKAGPGGVLAAGLFDARDGAARVEGEQARADVDGGDFLDFAPVADGEFAGAAADVDIQNHAADFLRVRHRARAVRRHGRFQTVAGADRDELARLLGEKLGDGARVAPAHGDAGQNQRAGIDLFAADPGFFVLLVDERFEGLDVDPRVLDVGRQKNVRFVQHLAPGHAVARAFESQLEAGENQMRGGRADVHAHAGELEIFLFLHV